MSCAIGIEVLRTIKREKLHGGKTWSKTHDGFLDLDAVFLALEELKPKAFMNDCRAIG